MLTRKQVRDQMTDTTYGNVSKRKADNSPAIQPQRKRSVLKDITNDLRKVHIDASKKIEPDDNDSNSQEVELKQSTEGMESSSSDASMLSPIDELYESPNDSVVPITPNSTKKTIVAKVLPIGYGIRTEYDREHELDPYNVPHYAQDIFDYYKDREALFRIRDYMHTQTTKGGITCQMRAILVDWMVEVQENFELNHETLYQAVKMADLYMQKVVVPKESLQLVGATALFISSKFDERQPPLLEDFIYICDDAYDRQQVVDMEGSMLKKLGFDIGFPLSYRFLRRYAKATKTSMETLTLARFILEMSLMDYEIIQMPDSLVAASAFLLALRIRECKNWSDEYEKYSGYETEELEPIMWKLNDVIKGTHMTKNLKNIRDKYAHEIFYGVANLPPLRDPHTAP